MVIVQNTSETTNENGHSLLTCQQSKADDEVKLSMFLCITFAKFVSRLIVIMLTILLQKK